MDFRDTTTRRADAAIWIAIACIALIVGSFVLFGSFQIEWSGFTKVAAISAAAYAGGLFYSRVRRDRRASAALTGTAQLVLFTAVGAPLSYIAASANLPLWDDNFSAWDRALGFHWMDWLAAMNAHPLLHAIFFLAYLSIMVQAAATIFALAITGHQIRLRIFLLSFMAAALVTIAISAIMPAQGVWGHLSLSATNYPDITPVTRNIHLPIFSGLRDGSFRILSVDRAEGIITFPSLHAALAMIFITALWPVRYLRWIALGLNALMIASTPVDGGHYFSDVVAGLAIAMTCWSLLAWMMGKDQTAIGTSPLPSIPESPTLIPDPVPDDLASPVVGYIRRDVETV